MKSENYFYEMRMLHLVLLFWIFHIESTVTWNIFHQRNIQIDNRLWKQCLPTKRETRNEKNIKCEAKWNEQRKQKKKYKQVWVNLQWKIMSLNNCCRHRIIKTHSFQFEWPFLLLFHHIGRFSLFECSWNMAYSTRNRASILWLGMNRLVPS